MHPSSKKKYSSHHVIKIITLESYNIRVTHINEMNERLATVNIFRMCVLDQISKHGSTEKGILTRLLELYRTLGICTCSLNVTSSYKDKNQILQQMFRNKRFIYLC